MNSALFQKRPAFSNWKMGRFFMVVLSILALPALAQEIIVIDETENSAAKPESPEKSVEESVLFSVDTQLQFAARPTSNRVLGFPSLGLVHVNLGIEAYPELSIYLSALGRVPVRVVAPHVDAFADLDDSYVKFEQSDFVFSLGYLRSPWRVLRAAALNDRLNPVDYRPGEDFVPDSQGRVPQWGMQLKTAVFGWSTEADYSFWYRAKQGSLVASEQNGVQIGHYQGALASSQDDLTRLLLGRSVEVEQLPWFLSPSLALRARRNVKDVDIGFNVVWSYDEVLGLNAQNGKVILTPKRAVSFGGELAWTLGVVLLKAEAVVTPKFSEEMGKTALLKGDIGLETKTLSNATFGFGVDGEYGDWLSGSFELIDSIWFNVPSGRYLQGVEPSSEVGGSEHTAHRAALALALNGAVFSDFLLWNLRGEVGINTPDILAKLDLRRDFSDTGFYVGAYATVFDGVFESPGWYRRSATQIGAFVGYHL